MINLISFCLFKYQNKMDDKKNIEIRTKMEEYISGAISAEEASRWALSLIKSSSFDELPHDEKYAVHLLFDLHDKKADWVPSVEDIKVCLKSFDK